MEKPVVPAYDDVDLFRADPWTWACGTNRTPDRLMDMEEFKARWRGWATRQLVGKKNATQAPSEVVPWIYIYIYRMR